MIEITGGMMIAMIEAREACKDEANIEVRIRKAMVPCVDHWMETSEQNQLKAAVAAALLESPDGEKARIERSFAALVAFSAALSAIQMGLNCELPEARDDLLPLMGMWHEERAKKRGEK